MTTAHPEGIDVRTISQQVAPCVLHRRHEPITTVNELHHVFPKEWQNDVWGEVRDNTRVSVCSTGHNNVHEALRIYEHTGDLPGWCRGRTRLLAQQALDKRQAAIDAH